MRYTFVDRAEAPARLPARGRRRFPDIDGLIAALEPGKVAKIELDEGEKTRVVTEHLFKSAAHQRRLLTVWEVGGILYAELVTDE